MTKFEAADEVSDTVSDFATIRIVGDDLDPDEVTSILHVKPTMAHKKGARIGSEHSAQSRIAGFGMWYFSTRNVLDSPNLNDHLSFIDNNILTELAVPRFGMLGLVQRHINHRLAELIRKRALKLVVTAYWVGRSAARAPTIPDRFRSMVNKFGGTIETDFSVQEGDEIRQLQA